MPLLHEEGEVAAMMLKDEPARENLKVPEGSFRSSAFPNLVPPC
jgi:hypothetical protein